MPTANLGASKYSLGRAMINRHASVATRASVALNAGALPLPDDKKANNVLDMLRIDITPKSYDNNTFKSFAAQKIQKQN